MKYYVLNYMDQSYFYIMGMSQVKYSYSLVLTAV